MNKLRIWAPFVFSSAVLVTINLMVKYWAELYLKGSPPRVLVPGVLGLTYTENTGIAFGLLAGSPGAVRVVISVIIILLLIAVVWFYYRLAGTKQSWWLRAPLILIFSGGLGNLYDRLIHGAVRDMIEFLFINFAIFNIADVYVVVGGFVFLFVSCFVVKDFTFT